jgi:hypothetical protein
MNLAVDEVVDGLVEKCLLPGDNTAAAVDMLWTAKQS